MGAEQHKARVAGGAVAAVVEALTPGLSGTDDVLGRPPEEQVRIAVPTFEGPLDLLWTLIQEHKLDILDIPIRFITEKYLAYLGLMRTLSIDLASEYLVMAATLAHIKSKMLLPVVPSGQDDDGLGAEEEDPRAELVRRLLEYQKYKQAGADLAERGTLGRDVFGRGSTETAPEVTAPFAPVSTFALLDAFDQLLRKTSSRVDHEVVFDRISISDRIVELTDRLSVREATRFEDLFEGSLSAPTRFDLIITFLALLEMCRMKLVRVYQAEVLAPLYVELVGQDNARPSPAVEGAVTTEEAGGAS